MKTTWLRNPHTTGTCGSPNCTWTARLYPCGWRCYRHQPSTYTAAGAK